MLRKIEDVANEVSVVKLYEMGYESVFGRMNLITVRMWRHYPRSKKLGYTSHCMRQSQIMSCSSPTLRLRGKYKYLADRKMPLAIEVYLLYGLEW